MKLEARVRAFAAFVRRGSFAGAAHELHISQPAVSQHIADIERHLGVNLIERRSRALTAAGEMLARHVLRAEAILAQGASCVADLREPSSGLLSILASGTPGTYVLPEVLAKYHEAHPGVRIRFALGSSADVISGIRSHSAEIGIVGAFIAASEIEAEHLLDDEIVVVGPPKLKRKRLSRDDLESLTWISREEGSGTRVLGDAALADVGITPTHRLALPSWEAIKLAVRGGSGIAACSRLAVAEELEAGTLVIVPVLPRKVRRIFSIIRTRDAGVTAPAEHFLTMLRAHCANRALHYAGHRHVHGSSKASRGLSAPALQRTRHTRSA